jgi:hypothetical protein
MQNENRKLSTDELVAILMDIYNLTEKEAKKALKEVTTRNSMNDF